MPFQFSKHYSREEARALLPQIRGWIEQLVALRERLFPLDQEILERTSRGEDLGGPVVHQALQMLAGAREILREFEEREIQVKDLDRGLIDFPAIIQGKEVFLCWEKDESDVEFWHELSAGFGGRERI